MAGSALSSRTFDGGAEVVALPDEVHDGAHIHRHRTLLHAARLVHSMQRSDSWRACSDRKASIHFLKVVGANLRQSCSGMRWRGSLTRSLLGSGLLTHGLSSFATSAGVASSAQAWCMNALAQILQLGFADRPADARCSAFPARDTCCCAASARRSSPGWHRTRGHRRRQTGCCC